MRRSRTIAVIAVIGIAAAVLFTWYLTTDVYRREQPLVRNTDLPGTRTPVSEPTNVPRVGAENGEPRKEASCRTTPSEGQASMSHEDCAFIASQIPVLTSNTGAKNRSTAAAPSQQFRPGADMPSDVRELKPLPETVTQRLPALRGYQYFLSGQDIVVVGPAAKIAFVVDVRVRPR